MINLKPEVKKQIIGLLAQSRCSEVRTILRDISKHYQNIDTYFVPSRELHDTIKLPNDPFLLANVAKCLDEHEVEITVYATPYINSYSPEAQELLNNEFGDPFFEDEIKMVIKDLDPDTLMAVINKVNQSNRICWMMRVNSEVTGKQFLETEPSRDSCDYVLELDSINSRRISLDYVEATFRGKLKEGAVSLYLYATLKEEKYRFRGTDRQIEIFDTVRALWKKYRHLNPKITLELTLEV